MEVNHGYLDGPEAPVCTEIMCYLHSTPSTIAYHRGGKGLHRLKHTNTVTICLASFVLYDQHYSTD